MRNIVFWDITPCCSCKNPQEPRDITSQKTAFFISSLSLLQVVISDIPVIVQAALREHTVFPPQTQNVLAHVS
jgi:hypothetical protein